MIILHDLACIVYDMKAAAIIFYPLYIKDLFSLIRIGKNYKMAGRTDREIPVPRQKTSLPGSSSYSACLRGQITTNAECGSNTL